MTKIYLSTQDQVQAVQQQVTTIDSQITTPATGLDARVTTLEGAQPAVAQLRSDVDALGVQINDPVVGITQQLVDLDADINEVGIGVIARLEDLEQGGATTVKFRTHSQNGVYEDGEVVQRSLDLYKANNAIDGSITPVPFIIGAGLDQWTKFVNIAANFLPAAAENTKQTYSNDDIATSMERSAHTWTSGHTFSGGCAFSSDIVANSTNVDLATLAKPFGAIFGTNLNISGTSQFSNNVTMTGGLNLDHAGVNLINAYNNTDGIRFYKDITRGATGINIGKDAERFNTIYTTALVTTNVYSDYVYAKGLRSDSGGYSIMIDASQNTISNTESNFYFKNGVSNGFYISGSGSWRPLVDNAQDLGTSSLRMDDLYATNTSITTSDLRKKDILSDEIPDTLLDAWGEYVQHKVYKWKDGNRKHIGIIAQDVIKAFDAAGLDWTEYAILCVGDKDSDVQWDKNDVDNLPLIGVRKDQVSAIESAYLRREIKNLKSLN